VTESTRESAITAALATAIFVVYALGACPTIYVGDSGELVTAVHLLGIPHPSGYPLYVMLGKLWTLLVPFGSIAERMSLFSSFFGALACALLYRLGRNLRLGVPAALLAALLLAFAPSFWGEANVQRVYTLGAFFVVAATWAAERWHRRRRQRDLVLAFFLCGLGATNHTFMVPYAFALAVFAVCVDPGILRRPRTIALAAGAFAIGLLPYAYLPIRSRFDPALDWGNPETPTAFLRAVTRGDFWERSWVEGPADVAVVTGDYLRGIADETVGLGLALAVAGAFAGWRRGRFALLPLLVMAANLATLCLHGSRSDIFLWHRYYIPSFAMTALLAGLGAECLLARAPSLARGLPLGIPLVLLATGWHDFDRSRYRIAEDFSRQLLNGIPQGASLAASDDNVLFVLLYLHFVEGVRPDLRLIQQGVGGANLPPMVFNPETDALYFTHHPNWTLPELAVLPLGLVFRVWRAGMPPPAPVLPTEHLDGELDPRVPKDSLTANVIGHFHYMRGVTLESGDWPRAAHEYALAARADPRNDVLFYNLGLLYRRQGLFDEALESFERSRAINPRHIASKRRVRAADKVAELRAEVSRTREIEHGFPGGSAERRSGAALANWHRELAAWLEARGEAPAAHGHRRRAQAIDTERG